MEQKYQGCTPEQGKKIEELGVTAKSHFVWVTDPIDPGKWIIMENWMISEDRKISAWSSAELGVLLPTAIQVKDKKGDDGKASLMVMKIDSQEFRGFQACYASAAVFGMSVYQKALDKHEARAEADLLIHLIKKGIVNPEDLKL